MAKAFKELAVKTGEYQKDGETKNSWRNCGMLMQGDDGGYFILLDRTFNPAGVPVSDSGTSDKVLISTFDLKQKTSAPFG